MDEVLDDLRSFIAYRMREGFESVHSIIKDAINYAYEKHGRDDVQSNIRQITAELLSAHRTDQAGWEGSTDCDRLDEAFVALNRQRIVARQDFSCCNNCGFVEMWDEIETAEQQGPVDGYVFYHLQCTQRAIATGQLLMAYGSVEDDPAALDRVANRVVAELRKAGLKASWQGSADHPIVVEGIVWRRRR